MPRAFAENLGLFTPAETDLAIIVFRRDPGSPIGDEHWSAWTGLAPRMKHNAIRGLLDKGLVMEGHGDKARYSWNHHKCEEYVRGADPLEKARTAGRAPSKPAEPKVHPECAAKGCQLGKMAGQAGISDGMLPRSGAQLAKSEVIDIADVSPTVVQPVAQKPSDKPTDKLPAPSELASLWPKTLGALQAVFALAGVALLAQLLSRLASRGQVSQDDELAGAVAVAARSMKQGQGEGLLLLKTPEALDAIRGGRVVIGRPPPGAFGPQPSPEEMAEQWRRIDAEEARRQAGEAELDALRIAEPEVYRELYEAQRELLFKQFPGLRVTFHAGNTHEETIRGRMVRHLRDKRGES